MQPQQRALAIRVALAEVRHATMGPCGCANGAVLCRFFWGYLRILGTLAQWLGRVSNWTQSCSCHPRRLVEDLDLQTQKETCPMRGRRAPEMACGKLNDLVAELGRRMGWTCCRRCSSSSRRTSAS